MPAARPPKPSSGSGIAHRAYAWALDPRAWCWVGLALAMVCLFQRLSSDPHRWVSSDWLWPVNVFTDVFIDKYPISGWHFSIAPFWFPDLVLVGLAHWLVRNVILSTLLAGFVQLFLLVGGLQLCWRALRLRSVRAADLATLATAIAVTLYVAWHPAPFYPTFYALVMTQTHVGNLVCLVYALAFSLFWLDPSRGRRCRVWSAVLYGAMCLLGAMSNLLFVPDFLVPLSGALLLLGLRRMVTPKPALVIAGAGWLAAIAGALANRILFHGTSATAQASLGLKPFKLALTVFWQGTWEHLRSGDFQHLLACAWLLAASVGASVLLFRRDRARTLLALFLAVAAASSVMCVAVIVAGGSNGLTVFRDYVWTMHYWHSAFLLPLFGWPALLELAPWRIRAGPRLMAASGALCLAAPGVALLRTPVPAVPMHHYVPPLVQYLDGHAKEYNLRYGLSGYWQARLTTLTSRTGLRVYQVGGSLEPLHWANNIHWYSESLEDRQRRPKISFVLLNDPLWKISRTTVVQAFGEPKCQLQFQDVPVLIYSESPACRASSVSAGANARSASLNRP